ncbi:MAG: carboxymuconolactone decarboxylase family protein [Proteobacteria bacterium]|nr:carboxymuconolactone decarboxylase family protein [Burkholderiales bacterium]
MAHDETQTRGHAQRLATARRIRREVLGDAHIQQSAADGDPLMRPKTEMSEYVWAHIWSRPGLSRKTRSVINLALLTAMNRPEELRLHINGALNNGLEAEEIMEVLLQCGTYCGIAAAKDSFAIMAEVFEARGIE